MNEIVKSGGSIIEAIVKNEEISSAIAETIRENKGKIVIGAFGLSALYIMRDNIKDIIKDKKIHFKTGDTELKIE